ncbi:MAG: [FeFe] hydrogenase, group A [Candidatus Cloacimonetes bacterium]|nr:[FeFe] hydrogenase, group A [Candidatus Cloacimonadota bacterium]
MEKLINVWIDGNHVQTKEETTIIEAAAEIGIKIPSLCYHKDLKPSSGCGICIVEIEGMELPKRACCTPVYEGMKIRTNSVQLRKLRKKLLELILTDHYVDCLTCIANNKCELQDLAYYMGVKTDEIASLVKKKPIDDSSVSIIRDPNKCIACGRCVTVCNDIQTVYALTHVNRGFEVEINTPFSKGMADSTCINCGQCAVYCPTAALTEKTETDQVWEELLNPEKHVVIQAAPAVRATLGEEFGMEEGTLTVGKMYAAFRKLGFNAIFDTNFTADLTIMEEGTEFVKRFKEGGTLPLITSCSPGWIKFMETYYSDLADNVSTCKSPQQMFGALVKTYYAKEKDIAPQDIVSVSIMPCTAKKFEARRPEMTDSGYQDVDYVLTTREIARMIKEAGIDFKNLEDDKADDFMGLYTGAATIFGTTGGVMEAALRSAYFLITGKNLPDVEIHAVRGMEGIKEAVVDVEGIKVKIAVAHSLGQARKLMDIVRNQIQTTGKSGYHFIEVMACPGGCVGGGGQPFGSSLATRARRGETLYKEDKALSIRLSHENPAVAALYEKFLGSPGSEIAHKLLHTSYYHRDKSDGKILKEATSKHH